MAACLTIGIQNVNSLWICYHSLSLLCLAAFAEYDIRHRKIKNAALIPFFFWCLLSIPVTLSMVPIIPAFCFLEAVMGFLFGGLLLLIAAMVSNNGIGGGDIKLLFLTGLFLGWQKNLLCLLLACVVGILWGLVRAKRGQQGLPWGPGIALAAWSAALFGQNLIDWYLSLL